jgi:hypothetical protein
MATLETITSTIMATLETITNTIMATLSSISCIKSQLCVFQTRLLISYEQQRTDGD